MKKLLSVFIASAFAAVSFSAVASEATTGKAAAPVAVSAKATNTVTPTAKSEGKADAIKVASHSNKHHKHSKKAANTTNKA